MWNVVDLVNLMCKIHDNVKGRRIWEGQCKTSKEKDAVYTYKQQDGHY